MITDEYFANHGHLDFTKCTTMYFSKPPPARKKLLFANIYIISTSSKLYFEIRYKNCKVDRLIN